MDKPTLPDAYWEELAAENPLGVSLTAQDARDWFDLVWFRYKQRGYTRHKQAIASWWARVTPGEIDRSRDRARNRAASEASRIFLDSAPPPGDKEAACDLFHRLH